MTTSINNDLYIYDLNYTPRNEVTMSVRPSVDKFYVVR
jgi:hypothetical protein